MARHHKKSSSLSLLRSESESSNDGTSSSEESSASSVDELSSLGKNQYFAKGLLIATRLTHPRVSKGVCQA